MPVDVNASVTNALSFLQEQLRLRNVRIEKELSDVLLTTLAAPNSIEQVFLNLLTNARDAVFARLNEDSQYRGRIVIRSYFLSETEVCVDVEDNGGGVRFAIRNRIFEPFFTTKETGKGTGLGLSISQKIVTECGGRIVLAPREGEGTNFQVILPVYRAQDEKA